MGKRLVSLIMKSESLELSGALEAPGNPSLGQDAGMAAGEGMSGVKITDSLKTALAGADAMIDFSTGDAAANAKIASSMGISCVIGTTALGEAGKTELAKIAKAGGKIVFSSNMSTGVNLLFKLCEEAARILGDEYDVEIVEMHHRHKKDSPSGTAVSIAEAVCRARTLSYSNNCVHGRKGVIGERPKAQIGVHAVRGGDVIGDHTVIFASEGERIELVHKASNRDAFAKGALRAVQFLENAAPGLYDMKNVLGL
jgi:4-hydroxy-tetrahydrodipicolinate reductase